MTVETREPEYLTMREVRRVLGDCSADTVDRLVERGELTPLRLGTKAWRRFARSEAEALVDRYSNSNGGEDAAA